MSGQPLPRLYLNLREASEVTGMSQAFLRGAVADGRLKAKRTGPQGGGHYKFRQSDLDEWFDGLEAA